MNDARNRFFLKNRFHGSSIVTIGWVADYIATQYGPQTGENGTFRVGEIVDNDRFEASFNQRNDRV
ncbi:hypothetical protein GCM10028825_44140 [Spirosoma agri]